MDRIRASLARAAIASGAGPVSILLGGRVSDTITRTITTALENVLEAEPVADLVDKRLSLAVLDLVVVAGGDGGPDDGAAVLVEVCASRRVGAGRVVAVARGASRADLVDDVDVEVAVGALAELLLHVELVLVGGPVAVDRLRLAGEGHGPAVLLPLVPDHGELAVDHVILASRCG